MIKIAMVGASGKMGQSVSHLAEQEEGLEITAFVDSGDQLQTLEVDFSVAIDFSEPESSIAACAYCHTVARPIVIGTTGHNQNMRGAIKAYSDDIAVFMASNMSVGANLITTLGSEVAYLLPEADIEISETHHRHKKDAPSGTALSIARALKAARGIESETSYVFDRSPHFKARDKNSIGFAVTRGGSVVGEHTIQFFLDNEVIELKHTTHSREAFATGALFAAKWLHKQPPGFYSMKDAFTRNT